MKALFRILAYAVIAIILMLALLVVFGISDEPELTPDWKMRPKDINRAKNLLHEGSKTKADESGTIELTEADLNLIGNYLLNRFSSGKAVILLRDNKIRFDVTATLPKNHVGKYLNISFRLGHEDDNPLPTLTKFKAGKLLLPSKVAAFVIQKSIKYSDLKQYFLLATGPIKAITIDDKKIAITYHPSHATLKTAKNLLTLNAADVQTNVYQSELAEIVRKHDPNWRLSLADLLQPLFALAQQRSSLETAIAENRLVIATVNAYVNAAKASKTRPSPYYPAFLYKRIDLAQHFIGAAAITASTNGQLAQAIGEEKELQDAHSGSGFSFVDLTADRAGTRFGELATDNPTSARKLQQAMAGIKDYRTFMPDPTALPEQMDEATFKARYQAINSPAYNEMSTKIDALIAATPIFQEVIP